MPRALAKSGIEWSMAGHKPAAVYQIMRQYSQQAAPAACLLSRLIQMGRDRNNQRHIGSHRQFPI